MRKPAPGGKGEWRGTCGSVGDMTSSLSKNYPFSTLYIVLPKPLGDFFGSLAGELERKKETSPVN